MASKGEIVRSLVAELKWGWDEKIEWTDSEGNRQSRVVHQESLMAQIAKEVSEPRSFQSDGSKNANKSTSKPPGNFEAITLAEEALDVISRVRVTLKIRLGLLRSSADDIDLMTEHIDNVHYGDESYAEGQRVLDYCIEILKPTVKQCRRFLGYEMHKSALQDSECDVCGGTLVVAQDASSDVHCVGLTSGGGCGKRYRREDWAAMLAMTTALVDTATAVAYTGRPAGTLYGWASEGRVGRYGKSSRGGARWSLAELPQALPGRSLPPPPPLPRRRGRLSLPTAPVRE